MESNKLIRISSITKKLFLALFAAFLLLFLLFHMCANLFVLADDGGDAYGAFCHFMGSNPIVKIFEVALAASFVLHLAIATTLWFQNRRNRPVRYHQPSRTRTAKGSKLAMLTGCLLLVLIVFHFYDFYFVKMNIVEGTYMVRTETLTTKNAEQEISERAQMVLFNAVQKGNTSKDMRWLRNLTADDKEALQEAFSEAEFEPDFYNTARQKFSVWHIVLMYLLFFAVVGVHIRHGFESAFQTFGLNHYKYSRIVEIAGIVYCWVICIGFAAVPLIVFFFK